MKETRESAEDSDRKEVFSFILRLLTIIFLSTALILLLHNFAEGFMADKSAQYFAKKIESKINGNITVSSEIKEIPAYLQNPDIPMPETETDGNMYIGILKIDTLSLELPIISHWSYDALKIAPTRYSGSVYLDNMVIAAHNYMSHFGRLSKLTQGDTLSFTDMDGNRFDYTVDRIDLLEPTAVEEMVAGEWDLTLFTCTVSGTARITVRCNKA